MTLIWRNSLQIVFKCFANIQNHNQSVKFRNLIHPQSMRFYTQKNIKTCSIVYNVRTKQRFECYYKRTRNLYSI